MPDFHAIARPPHARQRESAAMSSFECDNMECYHKAKVAGCTALKAVGRHSIT